MNNEKEMERHRKILNQIKNATKREELPNVSFSSITSYLANNVYFDDRHISQTLFNPVAEEIVSYGGVLMPQVRKAFIKVLKENYPNKSDGDYASKYNAIANSPRIINILIEMGEKNVKIRQFLDDADLEEHNRVMKRIKNSYELKELPSIWMGYLNKRILKDFNDNDFIKDIKTPSIRYVSLAYMDGKGFDDIESLVYFFCDKQSLSKDNKMLMFSQIVDNLRNDKKISYLVEELKAKEEKKLEIYNNEHEMVMEVIKKASRISQLPPNLTYSRLTSYLSSNSVIFEKGDKISTIDLKRLTDLLLDGRKWDDSEVKREIDNLSFKYYSDDMGTPVVSKASIASKLLYDKFSKLPKTFYLVEEINAFNKRVKEFTKNNSSNVNVYLIPNNKGPIDGGRFYNCYINRVDNLDLGELLPLDLDEIVPPGMDIDSVEWFINEYYDPTFKVAGGIILNKDETIGNVNVFKPNDNNISISSKEKEGYDKLDIYYNKINELFSKRKKEQDNFLRLQRDFLKSQEDIDKELDLLREAIKSLKEDINVRKRGK